MSSVNDINTRIDQTVRIFDSFYNYSANIPVQEYDAVLSYFESVFKTKKAAAAFTAKQAPMAPPASPPPPASSATPSTTVPPPHRHSLLARTSPTALAAFR
jgi:hypothetical protein